MFNFRGFSGIWRWLRENILYVIIILILQGCATLNPTIKQTLVDAATYATTKMDCEKQGKDYKCETPMVNCQCVERPILAVPAPATIPVVIAIPAPTSSQPPLAPTPTPVSQPVATLTPSPSQPRLLQSGESLDLHVKDNQVTFRIKGLRMLNDERDQDHVLVFVKGVVNGKEININVDCTNGKTRLITQDFGVPSGGRAFSEHQDVNPVDWNPATEYTFFLAWDRSFTRPNGEVKDLPNRVWMEAIDAQGNSFAQWEGVLWRPIGDPVEARVGSAYHPYDMPDVLTVTLP